MPRLPTILVIGSQAISTTPVSLAVVIADPSPSAGTRAGPPPAPLPRLLVAGQQFGPLLAPLGFLVGRPRGEAAQRPDDGPVHAARGRGDPRSRRHVRDRHPGAARLHREDGR